MIPRIAAKLKKKKEYIYRITTCTLLCMIYCEIFSFPVMWSFIPAMYSPELHRLKKGESIAKR